MFNCKKCWFLKATEGSKCACNVKKFDDSKLAKANTYKVPKPIKQVSDKKKTRIKEQGSELDLFKGVFKEKLKTNTCQCIICGVKLVAENPKHNEVQITPASFPHILPKGTYPELRYLPSNLQYLVCSIDHHKEYDTIINKVKKDIWVKALKDLILSNKKLDLSKYLD